DALSPSAQLSWRLFEHGVEQQRLRHQWRWHDFPFAANGNPTSSLPVFMINSHRVDTVEDARAYVARLRDAERAMGEVAADLRERARRGVVPPRFVFGPSIGDTRNVISGAPFDGGGSNPLWTDFAAKV